MAWTEETVETLRNMWAAGASAREIGERIDATRNAVIGKANRLGLSHRATSAKPKPEGPKPPMSPLDLNERMCRWPIGHPGDSDFRFCGAQRVGGRPYCAEHCALAYRGRVVEAA